MVAGLGLVAALAPGAAAQIAPAAGCLTWTPDESHIVYCRGTVDGASELFERSTSGGFRQLTYLGGTIMSADVSADGSAVTFHATTPADPLPQVFAISRLGPRAHQVAVGSAIITLSERSLMVGGTRVVVPGAKAARLTEVGSNLDPAFAPHGDRIGFANDRLGPMSLWSMNIDGSDQRELLVANSD